ncbi:ATP-dependent acyl-CoA ligase [Acrocarpospora phusangensis]|uniref:ATP-dependent acyl-CoA ligase n=1 Tax=Acrocarpospora phusangensis TaxID=1070424 RepID=A0A919Q749_9ACTN|nr:AMP-binding protein [Acrocarpospora phusangensis]GIH22183.1 ATP-dependent acyl-CoA ligase [Acrocarpospora phusangensis]
MRYYRDLRPTFEDRGDWALPGVLRHQAERRPDAVWLDVPEEARTWTFAQALAAAETVGRGMAACGALPGDRVLIVAGNSSGFVRTWLGCAMAGLVEVPINTAYEGDFLAHQVRTVHARYAVIDDVYAGRFVQIAAASTDIEKFWVIDTGSRDAALETLRSAGWEATPWEDLEAGASGDGHDAPRIAAQDDHPPALPVVRPRDLGSVLFTSGTTGLSKGVAMPHAQMYFFADLCASLTRLTPADAWMVVTPLFYGNAQLMAAYPTLVAGARFVLRSGFSARDWLTQIRESRVTVTTFAGAMINVIWQQPARPDDADNPLRCAVAAPSAPTIQQPMKARYGIEAFVEAYGLTEITTPILTPYGEERPPGACGLQADEWFDLALVDPETDEEVRAGGTGELVVRPKVPFICSTGYYNMPDLTVEAWRNLWFHTGDALRRDEDGWFYFVDRLKDKLGRAGENISSYLVEIAILSHPAVVECCVIAVPGETGEDEVMAYLIVQDDVTPEEVWEWCDTRVPDFAVPRYLRFVADLPKTPSQRVQRNTLRAAGVTPDTHDRG